MFDTSGKKPKLQKVKVKVNVRFAECLNTLCAYLNSRCNNSECVKNMLILSLQLIELLPNG